jgi:hypothetical protein
VDTLMAKILTIATATKKVYRNIIRIQVREFTIIPLLSPCARIPRDM